MEMIRGFSKLNRNEKIAWLSQVMGRDAQDLKKLLSSFWHSEAGHQKVFEEFSENTISNFFLPFGVAPNFLINDKTYAIPMVTEESSVVAAASKAAKFWSLRGGFKAQVLKTSKVGQVHFFWHGNPQDLQDFFMGYQPSLTQGIGPLVESMERRGGGLQSLRLLDKTQELPGYYQLFAEFETCDAMGANFINSVLESLGEHWAQGVRSNPRFDSAHREIEITMCILSNYTPDCIVHAQVDCPFEQLDGVCEGMSGRAFAQKFKNAVNIAQVDPYRATTHNKGIFNGVDAVVMATGNDFRAVEACGHTHAALQDERGYRGLTECHLDGDHFTFFINLPLALGTVGGLTSLHPLAEFSLEMLGRPKAQELMAIVASVGLAQNFAALKSLVTTGIQRGHMKMHLINLLKVLEANDWEQQQAKLYFVDRVVTSSSVKNYLKSLREWPKERQAEQRV